jgi:hypothetical protein
LEFPSNRCGINGSFLFYRKTKRESIDKFEVSISQDIRVGNISYLMLGIVQYIIFSTIPTLGQTPEPYGLGMTTLEVGLLQLPQALVFVVFVALGPIAGILAVKHGTLFTSEVQSPEGVTSSVPNTMAFNAVFLVGAIISLSLVVFMFIMKRRALKMGMPSNK